ncbi:hypothetical protein GCM10009630_19330 [Kribbella jejuensis]|uniref:Uncharacterized protein n=2 Tax=Kribbella jejuensis TaxID=236068 RepID=A0A542ELB7_9ACTN|nr:hypothetical protein FB475_0191 [Kribbella jejuensis]
MGCPRGGNLYAESVVHEEADMSTVPSPQGPIPPVVDPDLTDPAAPPDDPDISPDPDIEPKPDEDPDEQLPRDT